MPLQKPSGCYENSDHTQTYFNTKMSTDVENKCTATYPCLCEEPSQLTSTGYHKWIHKYNCPELHQCSNLSICSVGVLK